MRRHRAYGEGPQLHCMVQRARGSEDGGRRVKRDRVRRKEQRRAKLRLGVAEEEMLFDED